ncbi:MAG: serine protease, partial [Saprospiraceae bacterium]|nr:serine protease [Saprospiraceae bacterium]
MNALFQDQEVMDEIRSIDLQELFAGLNIATPNLPVSNELDQMLEGKAVSSPWSGAMEAIIKLTGRPALLVQNNTYEVPRLSVLRQRLHHQREKIDQAITSVGRVDLVNHQYGNVGTAWMIEENVMITNRHIADLFVLLQGDQIKFRTSPLGRAYGAKVDFNQEYQSQKAPLPIQVLKVLHLEKQGDAGLDLALLEVEASNMLPPPITLSSRRLALNDNSDVVAIGYPAWDGQRNNPFVMEDIFKGIYDVKRLSPGRIAGPHPRGHIFMHDCTTLGGSSGSLIVDIASGEAIGLHFSGKFMENNYAITSHAILQRLAQLSSSFYFQVTAPGAGGEERRVPAPPPDMDHRTGYNP